MFYTPFRTFWFTLRYNLCQFSLLQSTIWLDNFSMLRTSKDIVKIRFFVGCCHLSLLLITCTSTYYMAYITLYTLHLTSLCFTVLISLSVVFFACTRFVLFSLCFILMWFLLVSHFASVVTPVWCAIVLILL